MAFYNSVEFPCFGALATVAGDRYAHAGGTKVFGDTASEKPNLTCVGFASGRYVSSSGQTFRSAFDAGCMASLVPASFASSRYVSSGSAIHVKSVTFPCFGSLIEIPKPYATQDEMTLIPVI